MTPNFNVWNSDANRFFVFNSKGSELYYFDEYRIDENEKAILVNHDTALTAREIRELEGNKNFMYEGE